jgi:hypothetical protein
MNVSRRCMSSMHPIESLGHLNITSVFPLQHFHGFMLMSPTQKYGCLSIRAVTCQGSVAAQGRDLTSFCEVALGSNVSDCNPEMLRVVSNSVPLLNFRCTLITFSKELQCTLITFSKFSRSTCTVPKETYISHNCPWTITWRGTSRIKQVPRCVNWWIYPRSSPLHVLCYCQHCL